MNGFKKKRGNIMIKELCSVTAFFLECCGEYQNSKHEIYCQKGTHPGVTKSGNIYIGCYSKEHKGVEAFLSSKEFTNSVKLPDFYERVGNGGVGTSYKKIAEPGAKYKILAGIIGSIPSSIDLISSIYKAVESHERNSLPVSQISQEQRTLEYYAKHANIINGYCEITQVIELDERKNEQKIKLCA